MNNSLRDFQKRMYSAHYMTLAVVSRGKDFFLASILFPDPVRLYVNQPDLHIKRNQNELAFMYSCMCIWQVLETGWTQSHAQRGRPRKEAPVPVLSPLFFF